MILSYFTGACKGDSEKLDDTSRKQGSPPLVITIHLVLVFFFKLKKNFFNLFVWLHSVLAESCEIFSCGMWDRVPWPRVEPGPPALGVQTLSHWTTRELPSYLSKHVVKANFRAVQPQRNHSSCMRLRFLIAKQGLESLVLMGVWGSGTTCNVMCSKDWKVTVIAPSIQSFLDAGPSAKYFLKFITFFDWAGALLQGPGLL